MNRSLAVFVANHVGLECESRNDPPAIDRNTVNFFGTCVVYTKTIIYLRVVKSGGSLPHLCSKRSNMDIQG